MRKYIIGAFIGFVLATAASAKAEGVSRLIDQVVQGVFPVTVDGNAVGDAIVVDNKTYLPVREFGEATGYKVTFTEDREVILTKNGVVETPTSTSVPAQPVKSTQEKIADLQAKITEEKRNIQANKDLLLTYENFQKHPELYGNKFDDSIVNVKLYISEGEQRVAEYEQQLAALQAQQ